MKINNYKEYLAQISEGLNSPATVNWIIQQPDKWYGEFTVGKHKFQIYIDNYSKIEKHFLFKFKGDFKFNLINDVKEGSLISYLIRKDDKNIEDPIADMNIKPYTNVVNPEDFIFVNDTCTS